ncbi:unnamed protein product [Zymoseptoria tritici ST99CH_1A5]|uniref:Uncharacterized protein n=1 Tax=Zymoseptoria tritici ST99CH_1A5 TaxID=1276529 RepID=A0A1Y6LPL9_ZYMTR|nr:unnamed protein product [Zymoseptoria tritici ST99CH_1A5]
MPPNQAAYNTSSGNAASAERSSHHGEQTSKRAIIAGLSGSIAGLLLIGVMIFFFLRRKRLREEARNSRNYNDHVEKQSHLQHSPQPPPAFSSRCESLQTVHRPSSSAPAVDEDHRIIRMSTQHWPRPYAPGGAEGHRGSRSTTQLRVTNPDPSRPTTARRPSQETARTFLSRKRSAIGEALHGAATRLRASSFRTEIASPPPPVPLPADIIYPNRNKPLPTIRVFDRGSTSSTPSFRSYPSLLSSARPQASPSLASTILPRNPPSPIRSPSSNYMPPSSITPDMGPDKDPFKTPSLETPAQIRPQRPSLATLQKLWPHSRLHSSNSTHKMRKSPQTRSARSSMLTPNSFTRLYSHRRSQRRSRGGKSASSRGQSKSSVNTLSTARWSKRSDPFDLDRGSWRGGRGSVGFGAAVREAARGERNDARSETFGAGTKQGLYEGT